MTAGELVTRLQFFNRELQVVVKVGDAFVPIAEVNLNTRTAPTRLEIQHKTGAV